MKARKYSIIIGIIGIVLVLTGVTYAFFNYTRTGLTITAYVDADSIAVTDTYDGNETDNMGTTNEWVDGRVVFTTTEWNSLQGNNALSFKLRVEANEGIWVEPQVMPCECFETENGENNTIAITRKIRPVTTYTYNSNMTEAEIADCAANIENYFDTGGAAPKKSSPDGQYKVIPLGNTIY